MRQSRNKELEDRYGLEKFQSGGTDADVLYDLSRLLIVTPNDIIYDLGSERGNVVIFFALATNARCVKGVEIVQERVRQSIQIAERFKLENVEFIQGNVKDVDFNDGTIFYLYNPFNETTWEVVIEKLRRVAEKRTGRIF